MTAGRTQGHRLIEDFSIDNGANKHIILFQGQLELISGGGSPVTGLRIGLTGGLAEFSGFGGGRHLFLGGQLGGGFSFSG